MLSANIKSIKLKESGNYLLKDVNLALAKNNIYTITGNNGSGKSTLLFAIANILSNEYIVKADYNFDGTIFNSLPHKNKLKFRKEYLRIVFQDALSGFDPLKKLDYYFNLVPKKNIEYELKFFQLPEYSFLKELFPYKLSVGMAQRLSIVLAILSNPTVLLLDEPTSSIDLPIANLLLLRLKEFVKTENRIVLLTTQDLVFAKRTSNFIAKMNSGNLSPFEKNIHTSAQ